MTGPRRATARRHPQRDDLIVISAASGRTIAVGLDDAPDLIDQLAAIVLDAEERGHRCRCRRCVERGEDPVT